MENQFTEYQFLNHTLVLTVKKSFWASKECEIFPHRIYTRKLFYVPGKWGSQSRNPINNLTVILQGLLYAVQKKSNLIIIGSASRSSEWFARFKKVGLIPKVQLLVTTHSYLNDILAQYIDKIIIYSRSEVQIHPPNLEAKYVFMYLPADGEFENLKPSNDNYIFAGGGAGRDFLSLIEAIKDTNIPLVLITFSPKTLGYHKRLPENCRVIWQVSTQEYLEIMSHARFVVNPLKPGLNPHGQTTIVQALRMGKAVVSTYQASIDDYVQQGKQGLLVEPGDIAGYRDAILQLYSNTALRQKIEHESNIIAQNLTYKAFATNLLALCREMIG
jgi:glycosyltransferase involved in cell wall biosynthesis